MTGAMVLLLDQQMADVVITERAAKAAATCDQMILNIFEEHLKISFSTNIGRLPSFITTQLYNAARIRQEDIIQKLSVEAIKPDLKSPRHVSPLGLPQQTVVSKQLEYYLIQNFGLQFKRQSWAASYPCGRSKRSPRYC
jgi:hypothetical protein